MKEIGSARPSYRADLTGEVLAWVVYISPDTFSTVHPVLNHLEDGPVIIIGGVAYEIDPEDAVYPTKPRALAAYYETLAKEQQS